jgi:hypothetical protein
MRGHVDGFVWFIVGFTLSSMPNVAWSASGIGGNVGFWGDAGGGTQIEVAAHVNIGDPPVATFRVYSLNGMYELYVPNGTYYVSAVMARDGVFGSPRPEDVLSWWDGDGDGEPDPVTVSGTMNNGHVINLGQVYVDADATGMNWGMSWADAYTDLQTAIDMTPAGVEIWVAEGTYVPGTSRTDSFIPKSSVRVFGGFSGTETYRWERDWETYETILSGEIGTPDATDNCYHVVAAASSSNLSAYFDGFTITGGYANGAGVNGSGGGIVASHGGLTVANVTVRNNYAVTNGGGAATDVGLLVAVNSRFENNTAGLHGGGFHHSAKAPNIIINSVFTGNTAWRGGGIAVEGQIWASSWEPILVNLSLSGNSAGGEGGGIFVDTGTTNPPAAPVQIHNCIVWNNTAPFGPQISIFGGSDVPDVNYSLVQGGWVASGSNNISTDPAFLGPPGDLRIPLGSPAVDAGDSLAVPFDEMDIDQDHDTGEPIDVDADMNPRFVDVPSVPDTGVPDGMGLTVDIGAYEARWSELIFEDGFESGDTTGWSSAQP